MLNVVNKFLAKLLLRKIMVQHIFLSAALALSHQVLILNEKTPSNQREWAGGAECMSRKVRSRML